MDFLCNGEADQQKAPTISSQNLPNPENMQMMLILNIKDTLS